MEHINLECFIEVVQKKETYDDNQMDSSLIWTYLAAPSTVSELATNKNYSKYNTACYIDTLDNMEYTYEQWVSNAAHAKRENKYCKNYGLSEEVTKLV